MRDAVRGCYRDRCLGSDPIDDVSKSAVSCHEHVRLVGINRDLVVARRSSGHFPEALEPADGPSQPLARRLLSHNLVAPEVVPGSLLARDAGNVKKGTKPVERWSGRPGHKAGPPSCGCLHAPRIDLGAFPTWLSTWWPCLPAVQWNTVVLKVRHVFATLLSVATRLLEPIIAQSLNEPCFAIRISAGAPPEAAAASPVRSKSMKRGEVRLGKHPFGTARADDGPHVVALGEDLRHEPCPRLSSNGLNLPPPQVRVWRAQHLVHDPGRDQYV